jgi:hypothetical protein
MNNYTLTSRAGWRKLSPWIIGAVIASLVYRPAGGAVLILGACCLWNGRVIDRAALAVMGAAIIVVMIPFSGAIQQHPEGPQPAHVVVTKISSTSS